MPERISTGLGYQHESLALYRGADSLTTLRRRRATAACMDLVGKYCSKPVESPTLYYSDKKMSFK